ncbi:LacI family DNA-binding transcriptional regulator [Roseovarius sp. SYSU LYC5161]|uniref:LacI family DNA-binding transcriptional regulator n=1 Tax=Roseovarius halophilus (ex Wu et al. 2025) TaxID=3376060 RepID=UPI00399BCA4A
MTRKNKALTQKAIAQALGVSVATVSLALRNSPLIQASTRERVHRYVSEVGYVQNRAATALRTGRTRIIGVGFHDIVHPFFAEMLAATEAKLSDDGEAIFVNSHDDDLDRQARFVSSLMEHGADGLILSPALGTRESDLQPFRDSGGAVVLIVRSIPDTSLDHVINDDPECMRLATTHLLNLGHDRIVMLGGKPGTTTADGRYEGFLRAMRDKGLDPGRDAWIDGPAKRLEGHAAVRQLWETGARLPTAIACFNDLVAFGAMSALAELGIEVGRDVAVVGIDDTDEAQVSFPPLTTVTNNAKVIGRTAVDILRQRLADPESGPLQQRLTPYISIRESCGANRA